MEPWRQCKESLSPHKYAWLRTHVPPETGLMTAGHCLHTDDTVVTSLYRQTQDSTLLHTCILHQNVFSLINPDIFRALRPQTQ